jgi:hypothetical protein
MDDIEKLRHELFTIKERCKVQTVIIHDLQFALQDLKYQLTVAHDSLEKVNANNS